MIPIGHHLASDRRPSTHGHARGVHAAAMIARRPAGEGSIGGEGASSAGTSPTGPLLVGPEGSWDENEGTLDGGKDVTRGGVGKRDADGFIPPKRRTMLRQACMLSDRNGREDDGFRPLREEDSDLGGPDPSGLRRRMVEGGGLAIGLPCLGRGSHRSPIGPRRVWGRRRPLLVERVV